MELKHCFCDNAPVFADKSSKFISFLSARPGTSLCFEQFYRSICNFLLLLFRNLGLILLSMKSCRWILSHSSHSIRDKQHHTYRIYHNSRLSNWYPHNALKIFQNSSKSFFQFQRQYFLVWLNLSKLLI